LKIINLARRSVIQALVRPFVVVVPEERSQVDSCLLRRPVFLQVHFLVLDGPPQPLDEDIIQRSASAVHADFNAMLLEDLREFLVGVLHPLVGVEDLRPPMGWQGLLPVR